MKNVLIRLALLVVAVSIVLPVNGFVKQLSSNHASDAPFSIASGSPLPNPVPPLQTFVA